jgi:hypothetical protein
LKTCARAIALATILSFGVGDVDIACQKVGVGWLGFASEANARVGRPLTPVSAAGVARRTTRRVIRRGAYVGAIPAGCAIGTYYGYRLYYCGGVYYQPSGGGYVIVYF